jgi:predicted nuclease of predicted toxin-antitoxin system
VKLLIDENLPPRLSVLLSEAGHDAAHVRDLDAAGASDAQLIDLALTDGRTIVSADTDFGALLAATGATAPSVILVREVVDLHPPELAELLITCIEQLEALLTAGAMVALTRTGARVRRLPLL